MQAFGTPEFEISLSPMELSWSMEGSLSDEIKDTGQLKPSI
jgi:hypothetical protein